MIHSHQNIKIKNYGWDLNCLVHATAASADFPTMKSVENTKQRINEFLTA